MQQINVKKSKFSILLGLGVVFALGSSAHAVPLGTVNIVRTGHGANRAIDVDGGGLSGQQLYSGVYMLNKSAGTNAGNIWSNGPIAGFCIEPSVPVPDTIKTYNVQNTSDTYNSLLHTNIGTAKSDALSELWGRYYDSSWQSSSTFTASQNNAASAFAAAIWEIIYEDLPVTSAGWNVNYDGSPGVAGFHSSMVDSALANTWLHSLDGTGPMASLATFTNNGNQNYLVAVPEPTTIILLGLGGVISMARKRKHVAV